jgi:hypothetical protein
MTPGQTFTLMNTGARFEVTEVRAGQAIARGARTGARIIITGEPGAWWGRLTADNGQSGPSLFDSLVPRGPRYRMRDSDGR